MSEKRIMQVTRMAAPLGAIVEQLDVQDITAEQLSRVQQLFLEHKVLVFPDQNLTPEAHMAFAEHWGQLIPFPYGALPDYPNIIPLKNRGKSKDVNQHWHSDMTYSPMPPKLTMLYALEAPELGGETAFANQVLAYQSLSPGLRGLVDSLSAHHSAKGLARLYGQDPEQALEAVHPVARTHDETGEKALYVCGAFTRHFETWGRDDSKALLEYLFEHSVRPEFQARHRWRPGDLVMWDNRCLLHYAVHDHGDAPRLLHRLQVQGHVPA
ncbi:MAG: TauD/TfdA dioxygenase family protein [Pseudomonadales bacterium]